MSIVNDDGYFETELDAILPKAKDGVIVPNENIDNNVVSPAEVEQKRNLEAIDYKELGGIDVGFQSVDWSKLNMPFGSIKSTSKEDTPVVAKTPSGITITEGDINQAINVGMGAGPGTMVGIKSVLMKSKNLLSPLGHAQVLEASGTPMDDIVKQTGFHRGADGRWRYELDDSVAKLSDRWTKSKDTQPHKSKLGDIFEHPDLYESYPQLKDVTVRYDPKHPSAHWDVVNNEIVVGTHFRSDKGTFLHEIQHAIQDIEGFAKGTGPGKAGQTFELKYQQDIIPVYERLRELYKKGETGHLDDVEQAEREKLTYIIQKYNEYHKAGNAEAYNYYMKSAGETEARNVDTRSTLTAKERREIPPQATEDLPRSQQIPVTNPNMSTAYGIEDWITKQLYK